LVLVGIPMSFWAAAQLQPNRTSLALHCLALAGYEDPRLRVDRRSHGRRILVAPPLFPGYCFNGTPPAGRPAWFASCLMVRSRPACLMTSSPRDPSARA